MSERVKAADAVWITDRVPTRHDADSNDDVWFSCDGTVRSKKFWYHEFNDYDAWMSKPKTPGPFLPKVPISEPDTTLAASCDRLKAWFNDEDVAEYSNGKVLICEDAFRIITAAWKWDKFAMKNPLLPSIEPADAVAEWVEELIRLCERRDGHPGEYRHDIIEHLAKRNEH